jgi:heme exporter protein C
MSLTWLHKLASPPHAYRICTRMLPWLGWLAGIAIAVGLYGGLLLAPPDYQQGDGFRIVYVHAPAAWLSMLVYGTMAAAAAIGLVWRIKLGHAVAAACAPVGASFTFLALATGSIWGKPMWGTWWVWDARLTSELLLLFLFAGIIALRSSIDDRDRGDRASAVLAIVGVVNLPIIHYSVYWWNTLHQASTLTKLGKPSMAGDMLWPLLLMLFGFTLFFASVLCLRLKAQILLRERDASWLRAGVSA